MHFQMHTPRTAASQRSKVGPCGRQWAAASCPLPSPRAPQVTAAAAALPIKSAAARKSPASARSPCHTAPQSVDVPYWFQPDDGKEDEEESAVCWPPVPHPTGGRRFSWSTDMDVDPTAIPSHDTIPSTPRASESAVASSSSVDGLSHERSPVTSTTSTPRLQDAPAPNTAAEPSIDFESLEQQLVHRDFAEKVGLCRAWYDTMQVYAVTAPMTCAPPALGETDTKQNVRRFVVYVQMWPQHFYADRKRYLQGILNAVCGNGVATVDAAFPVFQKSDNQLSLKQFNAVVSTTLPVETIIGSIHKRVLFDYRCIWHAKTVEQKQRLDFYAQQLRRQAKTTRHEMTKELPCMPLVVERAANPTVINQCLQGAARGDDGMHSPYKYQPKMKHAVTTSVGGGRR